MKKKTLLALMVITFGILAFGVVTVSAETEGIYTYTVSNGEAKITACSALASGETVIPDTLGGYPVTIIGANAFDSCYNITSITIPKSITRMNAYAFENCTKLTSVNISDIASWCNIIFEATNSNPLYYAKKLYCNGQLVTKLQIPDSVTSIGDGAFIKCSSIKSVTIPDSVTTIGEYAFYNCTALSEIVIPDSVTAIHDDAFFNCSNLTSIKIGDGVTSIGSYGFASCQNVTSLTLGKNLSSIGMAAFVGCSRIRSLTIPENVTWIGNYAFKDCTSLTEINWNAENVADFKLNNAIFAFAGQESYGIDVVFGEKVKKIPAFAFDPRTYNSPEPNIKTVTIGNNVTSIGKYAFYNCYSVATVYYNGDQKMWNDIYIDSNNSSLTSKGITFYWNVTYMDTKDNVIGTFKVSPGGLLPKPSMSDQYIYTWYTDKSMTQLYGQITVTQNITLYMDYNELRMLNSVEITGGTASVVGATAITRSISFATDKDVSTLYCFIKYPQTLTLKSVTPKDFVYAYLEDEFSENGYTTAVVLAQYSDSELIPKKGIHTPFELTFDVSKTATPGTVQIEATEESCLIGNDTHFFEDRIPGIFEINPKLAESIEISGEDVISSETTYTVTVTPDYTTNKEVEWSIDNETIATVNENGVVNPVTSGTVTLTATAKDGSCVFATKQITVIRVVESIKIIGSDSITKETTYSVNILPDYATNKEVEWSISDEKIATVDQNGVVTPVTSGLVTITVSAKDGSGIVATKEINIVKFAESIEITGEDSISSPAQYTAIVSPDYTSNKEVVWSVDNEAIATVDEVGIITPVTAGKIVLTATAKDGSGVSSTKTINIVKFAESIEIVGGEEIISPSQYSVVILPEYTTNKNVEWSVSDETVATVDENGLVTPLKNGKIVLTAKAEDASGIESTKSIIITVCVRANSITSDVGVWDKEFDSDITEYTISVPSGTTAIYLTSSFKDATAKVNGTVAANGVRKKVNLTGAETDVEIQLTPTTDNALNANTYRITIICGSFTKTTISDDGKSFTITPINVETGKTVILALYDGRNLVEMQSAIYSGEAVPFTATKAYTNAKVMVWNDIASLVPVCETETVK